jgi:hypothetical protein
MGGIKLWEYCPGYRDLKAFVEEEAEKRGLRVSLSPSVRKDSSDEYDWEKSEMAKKFNHLVSEGEDHSGEVAERTTYLDLEAFGGEGYINDAVTVRMKLRESIDLECETLYSKPELRRYLDRLARK